MSELVRRFQQKDMEWMEKLSSTPFYSGFWNHVRITRAINKSSQFAHGVLLDVGCGSKPYARVFESSVEKHIGLEYSTESVYRDCKADFFGDAMELPMKNESVDTILCTEVLEHIPAPEKVIAEFSRVLKKGGTLITTAPFFYPIHDAWDFFRYSPDGLAVMMKRNGFEIELLEPLSGSAVTLALMFNLYWFEMGFMWTKWLYPIGLILRPILLLIVFIVNITGGLFEFLIPAKQMSFNHLTVARKI